MPAPVQDAVDRAAAQLGLSLLIEDLRQHPVWWCTVGPVDPVRTRTVLDRTVGPDAADVVREFGLRQATVPVRTPAMPERGMWARWAVPVRHDGAPLGLLWVLDPDGVVTDRDLVELTELATLAAEEMASSDRSREDRDQARDALVARLLRGRDRAAADELAGRAGIAGEPRVQVESPSKQGGWPLPHAMSAHLVRGRARTATSGSPLPLVDLAEAVRRAQVTRRALDAGARLASPSYDSLGSWLLVVEAPDPLEPREVHPGVDALTADPRGDLLTTARTVLDLGGDVSAAAEELHVHRTTLYYRLDRIKELTGADLRDGATRTDLQLALRLHAYRSL